MNIFAYVVFLIFIIAYIVSIAVVRKRYEKRLDFELKSMADKYDEKKDGWMRRIFTLKEQNAELEVRCSHMAEDLYDLHQQVFEDINWHECKEETPETSDRMLVCSVTRSGEKRVNIAYYKDGKWHGNGNLDNVIAWRPLPEVPDPSDQCKMQSAKCKIEDGCMK